MSVAVGGEGQSARFDVGVAVVTALVTTIGVWQEVAGAPPSEPPAAGAYLLGLMACVPLLFRRRHPVAAAVGCLVVVAGYHLAGFSGAAPAVTGFVAVFSITAGGRSRWALPISIVAGLAIDGVVTVSPNAVSPGSPAVYGPAIGLVVAAVVGEGVRRHGEQLVDRLDQLDLRRSEEGRRRLAEERIRIAREVHDVVAHTVAVIAVQAGVAADALDAHPDETRAALGVIRRAAREATDELRATVGILRADGDDDGPRPPAPGLDQLGDLLGDLPGLTVSMVVHGERGEIPRLLDVAGYRIAQEALTNVVRHAGTPTASIEIRYDDDAVTVEIADEGRGLTPLDTGGGPVGVATGADGTGLPPVRDRSGGFGLIGMRERAAALGGTVSAGAGLGGGFRVVAWLPRRGGL